MRPLTASSGSLSGLSATIRRDAHGLPLGNCEAASVQAWDTALAQFNSLRLDPVATMGAALAEDPGFIAGHQFMAAMLLSAADGQLLPLARQSLAAAAASPHVPDARAQSLQGALQIWADGDMADANRRLDRHLVDHPRDLLALQLTHLQDLLLGRTTMLRDRIGRALHAWSPQDSCWGYLLGMQAFGVEECGDYARAEALGHAALALHDDDAWAVHAVAHVYEMQGRIDEGLRWLTTDTTRWADNNALAVHNHWHRALMHLSHGDAAAALALYDRAIAPRPESLAMDLVDASALLWRLMLRGTEGLQPRWQALAARWEAQADWGWFAFNDLHALLALVGASEGDGGAARIDAAARRIADAAAKPGAAPLWADIAVPASAALIAFGREQYERCAELLLPLLPVTPPMGGSHAQRSLLLLTACEAARRAGDHALVRALEGEVAVRKGVGV